MPDLSLKSMHQRIDHNLDSSVNMPLHSQIEFLFGLIMTSILLKCDEKCLQTTENKLLLTKDKNSLVPEENLDTKIRLKNDKL